MIPNLLSKLTLRNIAILLFCWPFVTRISHAQGLLLNDALYEQQPRMAAYDDGNKAEIESLKGIYKIDLTPYCPIPQDQGLIASCTGWAAGYGALTIMKAIEMNWKGQADLITDHAFSALFIYNQIKKGSCDFGAYISDAAILMRDKGDALSRDFDRLKNNCDKQPNHQDLDLALEHRVRDYLTLFSTTDDYAVKVLRTKMSLAQQKPVVIGVELRKNFENIPEGAEYWYPQIGDTSTFGGHSMVVVGFDDGREAFEVMNSWGPRWANDGFVWIKYRDFAKYCHYGYIFIGQREKSGFFDLIASLQIRAPVYNEQDELNFQELNFVRKGSYYEISSGQLKKGALLQPLVEETRRDIYFYAFSQDARGEIRIHWPRDEKLDLQYSGSHESAIIAIPKVNLAIPGKYSALKLTQPGTEYWCFLFSDQPIDKLNTYLAAMKVNYTTDFVKRLEKAFGRQLLSSQRVRYASGRMQVESDMSGGEIASIVVKMVVRS
jgi:hypothetical protein